MSGEAILGWVERERRKRCATWFILAGVGIVTGLAVLGLTFCAFWLAFLILAPLAMLHLSIGWPLGVTAVVTGMLFIDSWYSRRDDLSSVTLWFLRETVGLGPRLLVESLRSLAKAQRLASLDAAVCANALAFLAAQRKSVAAEELMRSLPRTVWPKLSHQLCLLDGVLLLRSDSRITLTEPLRFRLRWMLGLRANPEPAPPPPPEAEPPPRVEPEKLSPHEILGVSPSATLAQIKMAYRSRMKECHPDRFPELDPATRQLAEEWTKSLNAAYEALVAERKGHSAAGRNRM
jgi:DnaJ-domain-containing protein 1